MKHIVLIVFCAVFAQVGFAQTGLEDQDTVRFGAVFFTTNLDPKYDTGGLTFAVYGNLTRGVLKARGIYKPGERSAWEYRTVIRRYEATELEKHNLVKFSDETAFARNESYSFEVSGKDVNEAYAKAKLECAECKSFELVVKMDFGWGYFDQFPIENYKGGHTLNKDPAYAYRSLKDEIISFEVLNAFISYDKN